MEDLYGVEGNKDLARDPSTNAVVNVNDSEYRNYLARRCLLYTSDAADE